MTRPLLKLALLALTLSFPASLQAAEATDSPWSLCRESARQIELTRDLPPHLLSAVAVTESGRWYSNYAETLAWPWTVMAEGRGRFLPSKAAAIETVRELQARGISNIDVGCMQINLHHHPEAFELLEAAFDPNRNVTYAADFLVELRREARSWTRALGRYHSREAIRGNSYRAKVYKAWRNERHRANRERQAALQAARQARLDSDL